MKQMKAVRLVGWEKEPELREVPEPEPIPGSVLLEVDAVGLCHSDLHLMEWPEGMLPYTLPFTLGHEIAGTVAAAGAGVDNVEEGERVLVYGPWGCERCYQCARGSVNICEHATERGGHGCGLGFDGGLAEYVLVPSSRYLVPIGDLDPVTAAPVTDAALTPYHAIKATQGQLRGGGGIAVIGVGGLGHCAIQILKAMTASRVVAVDLRAEALELAWRLGADAVFDSSTASAEEIRAELGGGAELVLDFVGNDATVALAAQLLGTAGHATIVGAGGGTLALGIGQVPLGASASVPNWGSLPELHEIVAMARNGIVGIEATTFSLEDAIDAYGKLRDGEILGRAVITP